MFHFCFIQLPSNPAPILALLIKASLRERLLSDVRGGLTISFENPLSIICCCKTFKKLTGKLDNFELYFCQNVFYQEENLS